MWSRRSIRWRLIAGRFVAAPIVVAGNAAVASLEDERGQDPPARNKHPNNKTGKQAKANNRGDQDEGNRKKDHQFCKVSTVESAEKGNCNSMWDGNYRTFTHEAVARHLCCEEWTRPRVERKQEQPLKIDRGEQGGGG